MKFWSLAAFAFAGLAFMSAPANAAFIQKAEWTSYLESFVDASGRIVDKSNGDISHSEGQGYGMLLAVLADDRPSFERIWTFTKTELLVRADGLSAWSWHPKADPHISDTNNATDGDILIAYALFLASDLWGDRDLQERAISMIRTIGMTMIVPTEAGPAILPGQYGFLPEDGSPPIVNPSYWIFEALDLFDLIDNTVDWKAVSKTGQDILRRAAVSKASVPGDWVQLKNGGVVAAPNHPAEFGYNNIRIPLYLMRAGANPGFLGPIKRGAIADGVMHKVNVLNGAKGETITEPGYRLIVAAMECVTSRSPIPAELALFQPTSYYSATMHLLMLEHLRRNDPSCLSGSS